MKEYFSAYSACLISALAASFVISFGTTAGAGVTNDNTEIPASSRVLLPDGRRIALLCIGDGAPTVVVDAGLGGRSTVGAWLDIARDVSKTTRICLHDRAGLGESDPASGERSSIEVADDLHAALNIAGERGPFILVGHSVGGLNMRVFAGRFPADLGGLVLVDSTHPDQDAAWLKALPSAQDGEDTAVTNARVFLTERGDKPTANSEHLNFKVSGDEARAVRAIAAPVIVLTHAASWRMVPDLPDDVMNALEAENQRLQREQLDLSPQSQQRISAAGGHNLPVEDRHLVITAILDVVESVRGKASAAHP